MTVIQVKDALGAAALGAHLLDPARARPVVVISTGVGRDASWIDPQAVADDVEGLAEVDVVPTGDVTWALSSALPPEAQVYGDAARVYSTDLEWVQRPRASRLYLCFGPDQGPAIVENLVGDAMRGAMVAGLLAQRPPGTRTVTGTVKGHSQGRAIVRGDFGFGVVREELVTGGVPIESIVVTGQVVRGVWHVDDNLIDVNAGIREPAEAMADVRAGDLALARVVTVSARTTLLELFPGLKVEVRAAQVTGNPHDQLDDLLTPGEVVTVRVDRVGSWLVSMADVDDDEEAAPAPSLLPGGPPWLVVPGPVERSEPPEAVVWSAPDAAVQSVEEPEAQPVEPPTPRPPSPRDLDPRRRGTGPIPGPPPTPPQVRTPAVSGRDFSLEQEARVHAERQVKALRAEQHQLLSRLAKLEAERDHAERELDRRRTEVRGLKKNLQKASRTEVKAAGAEFVDGQAQLRHDVYVAWVALVPAGEKSARPLPHDWSVGPDFLTSLATVEGISRTKVVEVIVQVLIGVAETIPGREHHRLRTGSGGGDPYVERAPGEYCMRVSLQTNTAGARRLHYWQQGNRIELSRIVHHDDMNP